MQTGVTLGGNFMYYSANDLPSTKGLVIVTVEQ
jgi:hypothetical protein